MTSWPTMTDVFAAKARIDDYVRRTPLILSETLSELIGGQVWLKLENAQVTGSFKPRGAANRILSLSDAEQKRGLVTISSGNHGRAVSYMARHLGLRAVVCLYENVPKEKQNAISTLGGEVRVCGSTYEEAEAEATRLAQQEGLTFVAPFDDPFVISGQATIGLEIAEDCPTADAVIIPLSGGGLFSGIALALSACMPNARRIGVANAFGNGMLASLDAGHPVPIKEQPSVADCMAGTISPGNQLTFEMTRSLIQESTLLPEACIVPAMRHSFLHERLILEGGAALPIAMLRENPKMFSGQTIVLVITGQNIEMALFSRLVTNTN